MSGLRRPAVLLLLTLVAGCGDGAGPGGGDGDGFMRATIDGQAWESDALPLENGVQYTTPGAYAIFGSKVQGGNDALSVVLSLFNIRGPGTYPLGMGGGTVGGLGTIGSQGGSWSTLLSGSAGTVTITTLTSDRIAGTFAFTAHANMDPAGAARTVTGGEFDVSITTTGTVHPLPANAGSSITADIGGASWTASTIAVQGDPGSLWGFTALNTEYGVSLGIANVTGPGTYPLALTGQLAYGLVSAGTAAQTHCCWGFSVGGEAGTGSITIETLTADRSTGTFSFTLPPQAGTAASAPLAVTSGHFDIGLP